MEVLVAGGTGFVGRALCRVLDDRGHAVTAASRSPDQTLVPASVETVAMDVTDPSLEGIVDGHDAVVNLVDLPSHRQSSGPGHDAVHADGTRHLVAASEETGVQRFVQLSGLGVDSDVDTAYFRAKRTAEDVVQGSALSWVIYRPSVVFGDGCAIVPFLERVTTSVLAPLPGGGRLRMQPIWVGDLAPLLADGLEVDHHVGEVYEIGGSEVLTLADMVGLLREDPLVVPIPLPVAAVGFAIGAHLPGVPLGPDQYRVLTLDNTTADNDVAAFGVAESDLQTFEQYLSPTPTK